MSIELVLTFPAADHVQVSFERQTSALLPFRSPLTRQDRDDLRWYLETYGAHSVGDPDDQEGQRIADRISVWGKALFDAVFGDRAAQRLFNAFQDRAGNARLLTISATDPAILSLPWELLHDSVSGGVFLFNENPRVSIRRRVAGAT